MLGFYRSMLCVVLFCFVGLTTQAQKQIGIDIEDEISGDGSGNSVSFSSDGTIVAIGAPYNDGNGDDSGHVRVFEWDGSN